MTGKQRAGQPAVTCEIRVRGQLGVTMLRAFPALHAETPGGDTFLRGAVADRPRCTASWPGSRRSGWSCSSSAACPRQPKTKDQQ